MVYPVEYEERIIPRGLYTDSYQSRTRNKLIAEVFYLTKDNEKYESGYIRVRREIKEYPTMEFEYRELGDEFLVEIKYIKQKPSTRAEVEVGKKFGEKHTAIPFNA